MTEISCEDLSNENVGSRTVEQSGVLSREWGGGNGKCKEEEQIQEGRKNDALSYVDMCVGTPV